MIKRQKFLVGVTLSASLVFAISTTQAFAAPPALTGITAAPGALLPAFNPAISSYELQLGPSDSSVTITPIGAGDTIVVAGLPFGGSGITITTPAGHTTSIPILSTASGASASYLVNVVHNAGLIPSFSGKITTNGVFTFSVSNYDANYSWSANSTLGSATINASGQVTVSGIPQGSAANVTVTASRDDYASKSASILSDVMPIITKPALTPTFSTPIPSDTGFTVNFTNYDSLFNLVIKTNVGQVTSGTASGSTLPLTLSGLTLGQSATITISTSRSGYYSGTGSITASTTPGTGLAPVFSPATSTSSGFTVNILNYDSAFTFNVTTSAGTISKGTPTGSILPITISGLTAGQSATVTASIVRTGYSTLSGTAIGSASTGIGLNPVFGATISNTAGFTAPMTNYDSKFTYVASTTAGSASVNTGGVVSVTGLTPGTSATVTVRTSRTGYLGGSGTVTGSPLTGAPRNPTFSVVKPIQNGFTVQISNYDATFQWSVTATPGSATIDQSGLITVANLSPGTQASVNVSSSKTGYASGSGIAHGNSSTSPTPVPSVSPPKIATAPAPAVTRSIISKPQPLTKKKITSPSKKTTVQKKAPGNHVTIITCTTGSTTRRIVGYNPKCPAGFTRKG
jgi:titin